MSLSFSVILYIYIYILPLCSLKKVVRSLVDHVSLDIVSNKKKYIHEPFVQFRSEEAYAQIDQEE